MMNSILPGRSGRSASEPDKIVVNLHGLVLDKKSNKLVKREPYICLQNQITAEVLEYKVAKELKIANFALPLFGLCRIHQQRCDWLLPSTVLTPGDVLWFSMRLVVADQTRLSNIAKHPASLDYMYGQVRDGFIRKQWDLRTMDQSSYASIMINDMKCHGYLRRLKAAELEKMLNFEEFCGPYFKGLKYLVDKGVTKRYCQEQCSKNYVIKEDADVNREQVLKEIKNCQFKYILGVLEEVSRFANEYKSEEGVTLAVVSRAEETKMGQGLLLSPENKQDEQSLVAIEDIRSIDVDENEVQISSFDTEKRMRKDTFSMLRTEDAASVGLLLSTLYKLSVNYMRSIWDKAETQREATLRKHQCYPPTFRPQWLVDRLKSFHQMHTRTIYILGEDTYTCCDLKVAYLNTTASANPYYLHLEYNEDRNNWIVKDQDRTLKIEEIGEFVGAILGLEPSAFDCAPLWLPYHDSIYHCRVTEPDFYQPVVVNKYTLSSRVATGQNVSVYLAKANLNKSAKSKSNQQDIAIKRLENDALYKLFTDMIGRMTHWRHSNLICLHGVSFMGFGAEAIMDYIPLGNLRVFINDGPDNRELLKALHLIQITEQLFRALVYLQEQITLVENEPGDLGSYHGNIKLSKLMVVSFSPEHIQMKLGDPGLNKFKNSDWRNQPGILERIPSCAPEILSGKGNFSSFSDIYALGVTLWEIWSGGLLPFREVRDEQKIALQVNMIVNYVTSGGHLSKPVLASPAMYEMMCECWREEPIARPSLQTLQTNFHALLDSVDPNQLCIRDDLSEFTYDRQRMEEAKKNIPAVQEAPVRQPKLPPLQGLAKQISSSDIKILDKELGVGAFGKVSEGLLYYMDPEKQRKVAMKKCRSNNDENFNAFFDEVNIMATLKHENVVAIEGYTIYKKSQYLIMELLDDSLLNFVRNTKIGVSIKTYALLAQDTAKGMAYLSSQKVIHKDLAARNVLLGSRGRPSRLTAKIGDFGLSRTLHENVYQLKQKRSPWKLYPPETLKCLTFTSKCDVWSYGCVVWEIFDCCNKTKGDLSLAKDQNKHYDLLVEGKRKDKPEYCPQQVYDEVIMKCWEGRDVNRPQFTEIVEKWTVLLPVLSQCQW